MKSKQSHKGLAVWLVCLVFILSITVGAVLLGRRYGLVGIAALFLGAIVSLQIYKMAYGWLALHKEYNVALVRTITNCWAIYLILNIAVCFGWLFSSLFLMAEMGAWGVSKPFYCIIIISLAVLLTIIPMRPFTKKEKYIGSSRYPAILINAFVPRFVILYTFVVYFFISFANYSSQKEIIPSLCVVYIAVERMISVFDTVKEYTKQEYLSLYISTDRWIRKRRGIKPREVG